MEFELTCPALPHSMEVVGVVAPNLAEGQAGRVGRLGFDVVDVSWQHQVRQTQVVVEEAAEKIRQGMD